MNLKKIRGRLLLLDDRQIILLKCYNNIAEIVFLSSLKRGKQIMTNQIKVALYCRLSRKTETNDQKVTIVTVFKIKNTVASICIRARVGSLQYL